MLQWVPDALRRTVGFLAICYTSQRCDSKTDYFLSLRTWARREEFPCLQTPCDVEIVPNLIEGTALATNSDRVSMGTL
jgi:hypothetical protein